MVFSHKEDELIGKNDPLDRRRGLEEGFWTQEKGCESKKNNEKRSTFSHTEDSFFEHLKYDSRTGHYWMIPSPLLGPLGRVFPSFGGSGTRMPTVRLSGIRYLLATRWISARVTLRIDGI
jgi:hypothetical protein